MPNDSINGGRGTDLSTLFEQGLAHLHNLVVEFDPSPRLHLWGQEGRNDGEDVSCPWVVRAVSKVGGQRRLLMSWGGGRASSLREYASDLSCSFAISAAAADPLSSLGMPAPWPPPDGVLVLLIILSVRSLACTTGRTSAGVLLLT